MRLAGVPLRRGGPSDDRAQHDQGRPFPVRLRGLDRGEQGIDVLDVVARAGPVHGLRVPAVRGVAGRDVLAEGDVGVVLDGDVVGVVEHDEVAQLLVAGERRGLGRDAFHHVAVGRHHVDVVVEGAGARGGVGVEESPLPAGGHGHPDRGAQALSQRSGGDLDTAGVLVLRMPGGRRAPGPQRLQVLLLQAVAREVELDVEREAGVAAGEYETVPAEPPVVARIVPHDLLEQQIGERGQTHRRTGMSVAGLLHGVGGQYAYGVDRPHVQCAPSGPVRHRQGEGGVAR